ncbi:MAG TPA: GGDEF domain-containing protein, partial [Woeseiaceae bacterium]
YGGEEFVILMPHTDVASGKLLAERIRQAVSSSPVRFGNREEVAVTTSIGIAAALPGVDDKDLKTIGDSLLARADVALYQAKASGRNRIEVAKA